MSTEDDQEDPPPTLDDVIDRLERLERDISVLVGNDQASSSEADRQVDWWFRMAERVRRIEKMLQLRSPNGHDALRADEVEDDR